MTEFISTLQEAFESFGRRAPEVESARQSAYAVLLSSELERAAQRLTALYSSHRADFEDAAAICAANMFMNGPRGRPDGAPLTDARIRGYLREMVWNVFCSNRRRAHVRNAMEIDDQYPSATDLESEADRKEAANEIRSAREQLATSVLVRAVAAKSQARAQRELEEQFARLQAIHRRETSFVVLIDDACSAEPECPADGPARTELRERVSIRLSAKFRRVLQALRVETDRMERDGEITHTRRTALDIVVDELRPVDNRSPVLDGADRSGRQESKRPVAKREI